MKFSAITASTLTALLQTAKADFDIYSQGIGGNGISGNLWGFQAYEGAFDCSKAEGWVWARSPDVSGGKSNVRCDGCYEDSTADIKVLEMNFGGGDHHFTIYRERGYGLFSTDDVRIGDCNIIEPADYFHCGIDASIAEGEPLFHCQTSVATSESIKSHRFD